MISSLLPFGRLRAFPLFSLFSPFPLLYQLK
jgi:hypothetical protein